MVQQIQYFDALTVGYERGQKKLRDITSDVRKDSQRAIRVCEVIHRRADRFYKKDSEDA
jgi:hypothetical protein